MARPIKDGVDYFPLDVVMDEKIDLIEAEFGLTGFAVVVKLYQWVYGRGYYCEWTKEVALLFSKKIGLGGNAVSEIVAASIKRGIFDQSMFEKYGILTSVGIQTRYFEAVSRRKQVNIEKRYLLVKVDLLPKNVYIKWVNVDKNPENVSNNSQSKEKESKEKENKINIVLSVSEEIKEEWDAYVQMRTKIKKPLTDYAASLALKELERLAPNNPEQQKKILNQSTFKCWQGLFPLKAEDIGNSSPVTKEPWAKNYDDDEDFLKGR